METRQPKVSIGLPVYDGANFLRPALESILRQDYTDFELIISDNASTDGTEAICREFAAKDRRIRCYRNETNIGASGNFNRVFELARGEFFKWAAHDDLLLPGFLTRCTDIFNRAPASVVLVAPAAELIDEHGQKLANDWCVEHLDTRRARPHQRVADVLRNVDWAAAQFGLLRPDALRKTRLIDRFHACDYVLLLELAILGEIWEIPEILFQRRYHPGVSTNANKTQAEMLQWFDPSKRTLGFRFEGMKLALTPRIRLGWEYARSIVRMPLSPMERLCCFVTIFFIWSSMESRRLGREYGSRLAHRFRKALGVNPKSSKASQGRDLIPRKR